MGEARRLLAVLDRPLRERDYIASEYNIADIAGYPWATSIGGIDIPASDFSALAPWIARIEA